MTRSRYVCFVAALAAVGLWPGVTHAHELSAAQAPPSGARPNVLVVVTDDQRARGTLQVMPAVERLFARRGVNYVNAFTSTPLCCPARASLMTGLYAHNHGVLSNDEGQVDNLRHRATMQFQLDALGYRTAIFGKYLNRWRERRAPRHFDEWAIRAHGNQYRGGLWNVAGELKRVRRYSTRFIGAHAARFLRRADRERDRQPWLLYVTVTAPHRPFTPEPRYEDARVGGWNGNPAVHELDRSDKPPFVRESSAPPGRGRTVRRKQLRTLLSVDDLVAKLFRVLRRRDENEDTLAFFLSDNGFHWGEHRLRGKATPYTASVRIPLLARWTGHLPRGVTRRKPVSIVDVAPTVFDATGVDAAVPSDGRSLLRRPRGKRVLIEYWRTALPSSAPTWAALRSRGAQYVEYYSDATGAVRFREFYDLRRDRWQLRNPLGTPDALDDPPAERLERLAARLAAARACSGPACR